MLDSYCASSSVPVSRPQAIDTWAKSFGLVFLLLLLLWLLLLLLLIFQLKTSPVCASHCLFNRWSLSLWTKSVLSWPGSKNYQEHARQAHRMALTDALPPMCHFRSTRLPVSIDCRQILAETTFVKIWWNSSNSTFFCKGSLTDSTWIPMFFFFFYKHGLTSLTTIRQRPWPTWHQLTHSEVGVFWVPKKDIPKKAKAVVFNPLSMGPKVSIPTREACKAGAFFGVFFFWEWTRVVVSEGLLRGKMAQMIQTT